MTKSSFNAGTDLLAQRGRRGEFGGGPWRTVQVCRPVFMSADACVARCLCRPVFVSPGVYVARCLCRLVPAVDPSARPGHGRDALSEEARFGWGGTFWLERHALGAGLAAGNTTSEACPRQQRSPLREARPAGAKGQGKRWQKKSGDQARSVLSPR